MFRSISKMATDGVIAVNKPRGRTSAQLLRELQNIFKDSDLFADHLAAQQDHNDHMDKRQSYTRSNRKRKGSNNVKIGHGGTLDPMATGVLIAGIGRGTKQLPKYLDCTKEYEAVAIFGASTDSYDREGKITSRKPYGHITQEIVEGVLDKFRGEIQQRPPMFSALSLNGKRLYEYAREGIPVPVEVKKRPCTISNLELFKFEKGDSGHEWDYPAVEASEVEKATAEAYANMGSESQEGEGGIKLDPAMVDDATVEAGEKRKAEALERKTNKRNRKKLKYDPNAVAGTAGGEKEKEGQSAEEGEGEKEPVPPPPEPVYHEDGAKPPVMHLRMTVSRGTYVRSIVHDIAQELGSAALLVALKRTRQGEYEIGKNVIEWDDFKDGNTAWEEKVKDALAANDF